MTGKGNSSSIPAVAAVTQAPDTPRERKSSRHIQVFRAVFGGFGGLWPAKSGDSSCTQDDDNSSPRPTVVTADPEIDPDEKIDDPHLRRITQLRSFPKTTEDAANLLNIARSLRQERAFRKAAAEHAVHQRRLDLQILIRKVSDEATLAQGRSNLQSCQQKLDEAIQHSAKADRDFGVVRGLILRAGHPIQFPLETSPPRFPQPREDDDPNDDSSSSCSGV